MNTSNIFSRNLVRFRKLKQLSQRELAKKLNISHRMVSYYEKNPQTIQIEKIKLIASTLDVKISDFFNDDNIISVVDRLKPNLLKKLEETNNLPAKEQKELGTFINFLLEKNKKKNGAIKELEAKSA